MTFDKTFIAIAFCCCDVAMRVRNVTWTFADFIIDDDFLEWVSKSFWRSKQWSSLQIWKLKDFLTLGEHLMSSFVLMFMHWQFEWTQELEICLSWNDEQSRSDMQNSSTVSVVKIYKFIISTNLLHRQIHSPSPFDVLITKIRKINEKTAILLTEHMVTATSDNRSLHLEFRERNECKGTLS